MIEVVTIFAPRDEFPDWPGWQEYLPMLALQRRTVEKFGHRHVIVSDRPLDGFDVLQVELPQSLMRLQLAGQIAYLEQWSGLDRFVFVDADCLIARDLNGAFGRFHLGLTSRIDHASSPINNGAMYVEKGARKPVLKFFRKAATLCKDHWGGDQEAISLAAGPVLESGCAMRSGCLVGFLSTKTHNRTPAREGTKHKQPGPFVVHFKGAERKAWMRGYAEQNIL